MKKKNRREEIRKGSVLEVQHPNIRSPRKREQKQKRKINKKLKTISPN